MAMARKKQLMDKPYLVVDLEATCDREGIPIRETEIIEIGAVLVDAVSLRPVDELQTFVRPLIHPQLSAFCTELTSIRQEDVVSAPTFPEAIERMRRWLAQRDVLFSSWGEYDRNQLSRERHRHGVTLPWRKAHFNVKTAFAERMRMPACGMAEALAHRGLPLIGTHHRGIHDARNIARLLPFALGVPDPVPDEG
ncbi:MAG: exonuclease domain-containing protein [Sandaracinaceae bacterium]